MSEPANRQCGSQPDAKQTQTQPKKLRDLSAVQYADALKRHGFVRQGFMGYYKLGATELSVSVWNAGLGASRRAKLAYLLRMHDAAKDLSSVEVSK